MIGLTACGAETASTAATVATLKAKEAEQAEKTMDRAQGKLDDAMKQAEQRPRSMD
jgi:N-acetylmuramic acid 6-phosphate (MurNAc-6-P) etherase